MHKYIHLYHYVRVEQSNINLVHFTENPGWSNPEYTPIITDVRTSDSLSVVRTNTYILNYSVPCDPLTEPSPFPSREPLESIPSWITRDMAPTHSFKSQSYTYMND
jgi:hypothetical protein